MAGNAVWRDYDFGVTARSMDDDALGVVFRYVDRDNFYRFSIDRQRGVRQLVAKVHGHYRVLAQSRGGYAVKQLYRLRVRAGPDDEILGTIMHPAVRDPPAQGEAVKAPPERKTVKQIVVGILADV